MGTYLNTQERTTEASMLLQSILVIAMGTSIWLWFTSWSYRFSVTIPLSLLMFGIVAWEVRKKLTVQDGFIVLILGYLFLYPRFVTYPGVASGFYTLHVMLVALALGFSFRYLRINNWTFRHLATVALLPYVYTIIILKVDVSNSFFAMNRNSPALYLITVSSLLALNEKQTLRRWLTITPSVLTLWVAWYSRSRTGLVVAIWLAGIILTHNIVVIGHSYWAKGTKKQRALFASIGALIVLVFSAIILLFVRFSRFASEGISSSGRVEIWNSYLSTVDLKGILIGYAPDSILHIGMHNSYLYMISAFGIISVFFYYIMVAALCRLRKISWFYVPLMGTWLLYSLAEQILPFSYGLFVYLPMIMLAFPPKRLNQPILELLCRKPKIDQKEGR